jgi:hypothetical protein
MPPSKEEGRGPRLSAAAWVPQKRWTLQEAWIWERVLAGEVADLEQRYGEALEPRRVSERFLLDLLTVQDFAKAVPPGGLRIVGARFPGALDLSGIVFAHQVGLNRCRFDGEISLQRVRLESHLLLRGSTFKDDVKLGFAKVGGTLDASGSTFEGRLGMEALEVGGHLVLRGAAFGGEVFLRGAKVGGQLVASATTFAAAVRLYMEALEVGQTLFLRRSNLSGPSKGKGATFGGEVVLRAAKIGGALDLSGATFHKNLDASGAVIEGDLRLGSSEHPQACWKPGTSLILRNTSVGAVQDRIDKEQGGKLQDARPWRLRLAGVFRDRFGKGRPDKLLDAWPEKLQLDGFAYRRLGGRGGEGESEMIARPTSWYVGWLGRDGSISPQPYRQLATVFHEAGADEKANEILYALRERERKEAWRRRTYWRWLGLGLLKWVIGYGIGAGYFRALAWAVIFTLIGTLVLWLDGTPEWTPARLEGFQGLHWCFWASLDEILPLVELNKAYAEFIDKQLTGWRQDYFYLHRTVGYLLGSFVVAGLAGLTQGR